MRICAISIDVEEEPPAGQWEAGQTRTFRGVENLEKILRVFDEFHVRASLFVTGEVLDKYPQLVEKWSTRHEIGCHGGYYHRLLDDQTLDERRSEMDRYLKAYGRVLGTTPRGYRAVQNSVDDAQFGLLEDFGFTYDSSVVPSFVPFRKYAGYKGKAPAEPYHPSHDCYRQKGERRILEIPESPLILGIPLNGTWLRVFSPSVYRVLLALKKPKFADLSMHAWDVVEHTGSYTQNTGEKYVRYLHDVLKVLAGHYEFMAIEKIASMTLEGRQS